MDRDEAVTAKEKSRFGYRAKAAPIRIFNLSRENLLSPAHLPTATMRVLLAVSLPIDSLYVAP